MDAQNSSTVDWQSIHVDFQVFAYNADEWEEAFGQTCRELMAKDDTEDDQRQDSPVFTQDDSD